MPGLSIDMRRVAASQDLIPWKDFMEGKLSKEWFTLQRLSLACSSSRLTIADWSKRLISQVLQVSHAQWIFRNVSLHDHQRGYLALQERTAVLEEIDRLSQLDSDQVPGESRYLLEIDFTALNQSLAEKQAYWLFAMRAAVQAQRHAAAQEAAATARTRRITARQAQHRRAQQRSGGRHDLTTGTLTRLGVRPSVPRARATLIRRPRTVAGAGDTYQDILDDWGHRGEPDRARPSSAATIFQRADNKRRLPD